MNHDNWLADPLDDNLQTALQPLVAADNFSVRVLSALPREESPSVLTAARTLFRVAITGALLLLLVAIATWHQMSAAEEWIFTTWLAGVAGSLVIGLGLAVGAPWLTKLDEKIIARVTGRCYGVSMADVALVRAGAVAVLMLPLLFMVLVN